MSDLDRNLMSEFQDEQYRYAYAESFLNTKLAAQIKTLREQREMTQAEVGALMGIKQPGYRRFEDVNHSVWKTDTLWAIARALGVRLNISFETFGTLLEEKRRFTKDALRRSRFEDDQAFKEPLEDRDTFVPQGGDIRRGGNPDAAITTHKFISEWQAKNLALTGPGKTTLGSLMEGLGSGAARTEHEGGKVENPSIPDFSNVIPIDSVPKKSIRNQTLSGEYEPQRMDHVRR